ncbi:MAG: hypothetical protein STHCBS139747_006302 [Sporothrix thermara]
MSNWPDRTIGNPAALAISTSAVAFVTGLLFGIYSTRGYLITPELAEQRRRNLTDPFESEASDIDDSVVLDHAPNWANGEEADVRDGLRAPSISGSSTSSKKKKKSSSSSKDKEKEKEKDKAAKHTHSHSGDEECKMVLVVRTDLGMTKGKIAAQCGHATLACYKILRRAAERDPTSSAAKLLQRWERRGQAKIALQAKGEDTLLTLMGTAHSLGVTAEVIADAGRTQIESGSLTVLGVGPAPKSLVDKITGHLKLL